MSTFGYDAAGRLASLAHDLGGGSYDEAIGLSYNPASQIVGRTGSHDIYAWNAAYAANRDYSVNGQNQYISAGPATFAYDSNGNLTSDGSTTFTYDAENRLVAASGGKSAGLSYDPLGRLFQTWGGPAGFVRFAWDDDALIGEYTQAGAMIHRYIHGGDKGADDPLIWYDNFAGGWRRGLHADQQGSIIAVTDMAGTPIAINAYDEYGIPATANTGRFQYTGQAWIPELGMYYYKARIYSPYIGRFMQVDPIGYEGGLNLYAYVGGDPINRTDPTGEACIIANGWSAYCRRSELYYQIDRKFAGQTRFFGAASMTMSMMANLSIPVFNRFVSGETRGFMSKLSGDIESMNMRIAKGIESGRIGGGQLDARLVHAEQNAVQAHLNALGSDARQRVVSEVNSVLNPSGVSGAAASFYESDRAYQSVLNGVREKVGGRIDFGNQAHREAIGNALIKQVRRSGACNDTRSRMPTC